MRLVASSPTRNHPRSMKLTKNVSQPELVSSLKTSSLLVDDDELARASRNIKFMTRPICVPAVAESQSLVSSSSDNQSKKSIGFMAAMMRSDSGCRRTRRGISRKCLFFAFECRYSRSQYSKKGRRVMNRCQRKKWGRLDQILFTLRFLLLRSMPILCSLVPAS